METITAIGSVRSIACSVEPQNIFAVHNGPRGLKDEKLKHAPGCGAVKGACKSKNGRGKMCI